MPGEVKRATRVGERLKEELAFTLAREVRDPRVKNVLISRVEMPDDLRLARVYFRMLEEGDSEERRKETIAGLTRAGGMIRNLIAKRMNMKFAPELKFFYDDGQDRQARIEQLLHEVKEEKKGK